MRLPSTARHAALALLGIALASPGHAALLGRDLDGNAATYEAYYDTALNISWLADANFMQTSGFDADGHLGFFDANTWAAGLNIGGTTGWRLPGLTPVNGVDFNYNFTTDGSSDRGYANTGVGWGLHSEMGHLFYVTLGNSAFSLTNTGPFANVQAGDYWTNRGIGVIFTKAFFFNQGIGLQDGANPAFTLSAWAVHDGDVAAAVPEPETYALMLLGLTVLAATRGRRGGSALSR